MRHNLQRHIQHRFHPFGVGFPQFPRLGFGEIFIAEARKVHHLAKGFPKPIKFYAFANFLAVGTHFGKGLAVKFAQFARHRRNPVKILLYQHQGPIHQIAENGQEFVVVARLIVLPRKVVVFGFGGVGGKHIAQHVLFSRQLFQVFVQPYGPVARGGNFIALQVQKLVGRHVFGQNVTAFGFKHHREDNAVKNDVVFAYKMHQLGIIVFPIFFPSVGQKFFGGRDIADGRVKPYVEHLSGGFAFGKRQLDAPVEVARNGAGQKALVYPRLALSVNIHLPIVLVAFQNPLAQKVFILPKGQIPVLGFFLYGAVAANGRLGVYEFVGAEGGAAFLALVAVGLFVAAVWTGAGDVAVGQKLFVLFVVVLQRGLFFKTAFLVEGFEKVGSRFGMQGR